MRHMILRTSMIAMALLAAGAVAAQQPAETAVASARPPACASVQHRQFDFWLGEWEVRNAAGKLAGENRITRVQGGCALLEEWRGAGGVTGMSLNIYDADRKRWHQTWVDNTGGLLVLDGEFSDGRMVLAGEALSDDVPPRKTLQRITWTPQGDGVRQVWETSADGGRTWTLVFDGRYARRKAP